MTNRFIWLLCLFTFAGAVHAQTPEELHSMFQSNQVFALRDAVKHTDAPLFYRGAVEASLNQIKPTERDLRRFIHAAPHSHDADEARELLFYVYFRNGLYRKALSELQEQLVEKPNAADVKNTMPLLKALGESEDMVIVKRKSSLLQMQNGNLPIKLEGKDASYPFDTGSSVSVMSESEARRLGLTTRSVTTNLTESSGTDVAGFRVATAKNLIIGRLHLRNVAFLVLPDGHEPFVEMQVGSRGILGLPILLAMQTVRWKATGTFEFSFPSQYLPASNMLFHGNTPVIQVSVQNKFLDFALDTGAIDTDLNSKFAREFPDLVSAGQKESHKITGFGGSNTYDSVLLPSVAFRIGGRDVLLKPAHVFVTHSMSGIWAGNLGMDLLNQAHAITLDFQAMNLNLQ